MTAPTPLSKLFARDLIRGLGVGVFASLPLIAVEWLLTLIAAPDGVGGGAALQVLGLSATLIGLVSVGAGLLCAAAAVLFRLALLLWSPARARAHRGLFSAAPEVELGGPDPRAAWVWIGPAAAAIYIGLSAFLTLELNQRFNAPAFVAVLLGGLQLGLILMVGAGAALGARWLSALGRRLGPGRFNPLTRLGPAIAGLMIIGLPMLWLVVANLRQVRALFPGRHLVLLVIFGVLVWLATRRRAVPSALRLVVGLVIGAGLIAWGLTGAWPEGKIVALRASPPMTSVMTAVRLATDIDRDGYGSLLGENDCAPLDPEIRPGAKDLPDNGIDENCNGRDFSLKNPANPRQEKLPVPGAFVRPWNVLLITVDTLRYDHTGFGGYERDTTPNLDRFAAEAIDFTFANAPSAGTMASIPSILVSRFFHSGIALIEHGRKAKLPVSLHPSNVLMAEVMKRGGYTTGAILNHRYFEMGQRQGFDHYDNEMQKVNHKGITSPQMTDKALAWLKDRQGSEKWFLWVHYLDPHGDYVPHPGEPSFGEKPKDLYDGEIRFTDKHLGRLLKGLSKMDGGERTIVILTSDHGDGFREHGFINHGMALYRELLHVPLLVKVPGVKPARVDGAVTPMDILPTVADLTGIDTTDLAFEGESLVPQLFYGWDAHHRVVFSETNYRRTLRAAVTSKYKLIHDLGANTHELYDLTADPWEKKNLWGTAEGEAAGKTMSGYLEDWLERVFYARDARTNQAAYKRSKVLVDGTPTPANALDLAIDDGAVKLVGWDTADTERVPGQAVRVTTYFGSVARTQKSYGARLVLMHENGQRIAGPRKTIGGDLFDARRWRPGEHIRQPLDAKIPTRWAAGTITLAIETDAGPKAPVSIAGKPGAATLGPITLVPLADRALAPVDAATLGTPGGIAAEYFEGMRFERSVLKRVDKSIRFSTAKAVAPGLPKNRFSARWTGYLKLTGDGIHTVCVESDDGSRATIGGELVVDDWSDHSKRRTCGEVLALGGWHPLTVEYYDHGARAHMSLLAGRSKGSAKPVPTRALCCDAETPTPPPVDR